MNVSDGVTMVELQGKRKRKNLKKHNHIRKLVIESETEINHSGSAGNESSQEIFIRNDTSCVLSQHNIALTGLDLYLAILIYQSRNGIPQSTIYGK